MFGKMKMNPDNRPPPKTNPLTQPTLKLHSDDLTKVKLSRQNSASEASGHPSGTTCLRKLSAHSAGFKHERDSISFEERGFPSCDSPRGYTSYTLPTSHYIFWISPRLRCGIGKQKYGVVWSSSLSQPTLHCRRYKASPLHPLHAVPFVCQKHQQEQNVTWSILFHKFIKLFLICHMAIYFSDVCFTVFVLQQKHLFKSLYYCCYITRSILFFSCPENFITGYTKCSSQLSELTKSVKNFCFLLIQHWYIKLFAD